MIGLRVPEHGKARPGAIARALAAVRDTGFRAAERLGAGRARDGLVSLLLLGAASALLFGAIELALSV